MQYATRGAGPDVLVIHGRLGGFDAGLEHGGHLLLGDHPEVHTAVRRLLAHATAAENGPRQ